MLVADKEARENVRRNVLLVETRPKTILFFVVATALLELSCIEDVICDGEEWHVLNVRVVLDTVANDMVHVMGVLPPSEPDTTQSVTEEDTKECIIPLSM